MKKYVYLFQEGRADMKALLGGKGANLAEMTTLGIPVPSGFTITTETCHLYYESGKKFPQGLTEQIDANIARLEKTMGTKFDDTANPLLVRCSIKHAWYDGYNPKSWNKRSSCRSIDTKDKE